MKLNQSQLERYSRQIALDDFAEEKQIALLNSKVLIIGCGGLGSLASLSLAALDIGEHLKDEMLVVDALKLDFKKYRIS